MNAARIVSVLLAGLPISLVGLAVPVAAQTDCAAPGTEVLHERPWAQQRLAPERAWSLTRGAGIIVAVVGTGVSATPPQLAGAVLPGVDVGSGGRGDTDCAGHGTFAAALVAARPLPDVGLVGIAPEAAVLPVRVTVDPARTEPAALAAGIRAAVEGGADVIAVTLASNVGPPAMREAIELARTRDVLVVASAALPTALTAAAAENVRPQAFPAVLPGVLAVAAIGRDGTSEARALSAQPALAAPGEELIGLAPTGAGQVHGSAAELAVTFVAGAAALVRARHPALTAAEVAARLTDSADHPPGPLPDPALGYGVVDPAAAVGLQRNGADTRVAAPAAAGLTLPADPVRDQRPARVALAVAAGVLGLALLSALVAGSVVAARRRSRQAPVVGAGAGPGVG